MAAAACKAGQTAAWRVGGLRGAALGHVQGIDAGRAFPTWPLMGETFFPADAFYLPDGGPAVLA